MMTFERETYLTVPIVFMEIQDTKTFKELLKF